MLHLARRASAALQLMHRLNASSSRVLDERVLASVRTALVGCAASYLIGAAVRPFHHRVLNLASVGPPRLPPSWPRETPEHTQIERGCVPPMGLRREVS